MLNFELEEFPDGSEINSDPEYPSLNCEFETVVRRGRNKPVMGSGLVRPVKGKPVIGEPVTGSGIAAKGYAQITSRQRYLHQYLLG